MSDETEWDEHEVVLLKYINETPMLQSMLYDSDLMPEQATSAAHKRRTLIIAGYWRANEFEQRSKQDLTGGI